MSQRSRFKQKGRTGPTFVMIPHFVLESPQWGQMDAFALKLLWELARQYRGNNNGDLSATAEMLKDRSATWSSKDTLPKKLRYLEDRGWIIKTRQGGRHIGCNLYAITWWPVDGCGGKHQHPSETKASHAWKNAIDTPPAGERNPVSRGAKASVPRQTGSKVVPLRTVA